ncbi:MAG: hypothetical protein QOJ70_1515 [Acidobacteriota bacterium]|jgi:hypothetical protein|nr:hypothetical protein [Acidobacteriota bacterium]
MRAAFLSLLLLCLGASTQSQLPDAASVDAGGVVVVKFNWSKERIEWESDPFSGTTESFSDMRRRAADDKRRERAQASGNIGEANKIEREARAEQVIKARPPAPPRYAFLYKATVRNAGAKTVKEFDWDYVFFDAETRQELGRRQFTSAAKIAPGKTREFSFTVPAPPTQKIGVQALDSKERDGLSEQVFVVRILYDDGTEWHRP